MPDSTYQVARTQDGAQIGRGMTLDVARAEAARLNAEAKIVQGTIEVGGATKTVYASMFLGEVCRYEVRTASGVFVQ